MEPLSPAEADAIVAHEEMIKSERKRIALEQLNAATVISEGSYTTKKGNTVMVREVVKPLPPTTTKTKAKTKAKATPSPFGFAQENADNPAKQTAMLMFNAIVYGVGDNRVSQVIWQNDEGVQHSVVLPVDWEAVSQITQLETRSVNYMLMHSVQTAPDASETPPELTRLRPLPEPLKSLLKHYRADQQTYKLKAHNRAAIHAARDRYKKANPPEPETYILNFYNKPAATTGTSQK